MNLLYNKTRFLNNGSRVGFSRDIINFRVPRYAKFADIKAVTEMMILSSNK